MKTRDYISLHSEDGGPALAFCCVVMSKLAIRIPHPDNETDHCPMPCGDVTKTEFGMQQHLLYVHGIKVQGDLFNDRRVQKEPEKKDAASAREKKISRKKPRVYEAVDAQLSGAAAEEKAARG